MNKTEFIKEYQRYREQQTGEHISLTSINNEFDMIKNFISSLVDSKTNVSIPGFFNLKYKTREAGAANVAGKIYNLPAKTTPVIKLSSSFNKLG